MKKIWKHFFVTATIAISMAMPVFGAEFKDVADTAWYASQLDLMVEMNVVSGYEDGTFRPQNSVTFGEFSKMLCSLSGISASEKTENHWASGFVNGVYEQGWFGEYPSDLNAPISRYAVAEAVFYMMDYEAVSGLESPFVDIDDAVATTLYDFDIMKGSDEGGKTMFLPESDVTRAELCAILNRVVSGDMEVEITEVITEEVVEEIAEASHTYTLPNISKPDVAGTISADYFDQMIGYMMVNNVESMSCTFDGKTWRELDTAGVYDVSGDSFLRMQDKYHEIGCYYECLTQEVETIGGDSVLTLTIESFTFSNAEIMEMQKQFTKEINGLVASMFADGSISEGDSEYNKALYFYKWCALNMEYDVYYQSESYTGYGALTTGKAVCQGYTAVFNALCNAVGIECYGISGRAEGDSHIWNYAKLDGNWLYVDATFGDPVPDHAGYCDPAYFGLTKTELLNTHSFDSIYQ